MNKCIFIIILTIIVNSSIFSQENNNGQFNLKSGSTEQKNALSIDFGTLIWDLSTGGFGIGAGYERSVHKNFSVLGYFNYSISGSSSTDLRPKGNLNIGINIGFMF